MKVPFVCSLVMGDQSINLFSRIDVFLPWLSGKGDYIPFIPGWRCSTKKAKTKYSIFYFSAKDSKLIYSPNRQLIKVYGDVKYFADGQTLAYLAYSLFELDRQKHHETTTHLAACSKNGKGIILFGERGSGKTSILLALCRDHGYKLIANDLGLIGFDKKLDQVYINEGTKIFGLRHTAAKMHHPDLLKLFSKDVTDSWTTKVFIPPEKIGISREKKRTVIYNVFFCHLYANKKEQLFSKRMSGSWIKVNLYENFSRYIRGSSLIPFIGGEGKNNIGYIPSLDQFKFHRQRVELIDYLVNKLGVIYVSGGNLHQVCDYILNKTITKT